VSFLGLKKGHKIKVFAAIHPCKQKLSTTLLPLWHLRGKKAILFPSAFMGGKGCL
jgi:hypothetical protein